MRKSLFVLALFLVACGGNGSDPIVVPDTAQLPAQHVPEITALALSPDVIAYMEGGGSVTVSAEIAFRDAGSDLQTLWVRVPDGTTVEFDEPISTETGTFTQDFTISTQSVGTFSVEFWLVDQAGDSSDHVTAAFTVFRHAPQINGLALSPDTVANMQGNGSVVITAEIAFSDAGSDLQTLWVRMPDGTTLEFDELTTADRGTFTEELTLSTNSVGAFTVEFWLEDRAGDHSFHHRAAFNVVGQVPGSDWTSRLLGLPYALNDVIWNGSVFVAVGGSGTILTSVDGIEWVTRESGTDAYLSSVAAHGPEIVAVGGDTVLLSTDHGENWIIKNGGVETSLAAVAVNASQVVIAAFSLMSEDDTLVMVSEDRGDTWQTVFSQSYSEGVIFTDLIYRDGLFVAVADTVWSRSGGRIFVSPDGTAWNEIFSDPDAGLHTVVHDGRRFIAAGLEGAVFSSFDGFSWSEILMPVQDIDYLSAAWSGSKLMLAGGYYCRDFDCVRPQVSPPSGISSEDNGVTWNVFTIDGDYQSRGLAFGNGRFVSVGQTSPLSREGAIYTAETPTLHVPEITALALSPGSVAHMDGGGSVTVSAEIAFRDAGSDLQMLWIRMPDGTLLEFDEPFATGTGTFTENFTMSTETIGAFTMEFWLVDGAGNSSNHVTTEFNVVGNVQSSDWTNRLSGLPYVLDDVIWDGTAFVAVGDSGAILTSADGIDWVARESGTVANLNAVAAYGSEIFVVGDETVLLSTDHGESWNTKERHFGATDLTAAAVTSSQVVVSGFSYGLAGGILSRSEDRGNTWHFAGFWPAGDMIYRDGLFVAAVNNYLSYRARVAVSSDGSAWYEIIVREEGAALEAIVHDGSQFIVAGEGGAVFTSFDGLNWTEIDTPVEGANYLSAAWNGSKLLLAGAGDPAAFPDSPIGVASIDGGVTWEVFNIDGNYQSRGMAFGNGRFVSVGQTTPVSGEGAIYTAE